MHISTESPSARFPGDAKTPPDGADAVSECDFCGGPVRRETALPRIHRDDDGVELVPMCPDCERGTD